MGKRSSPSSGQTSSSRWPGGFFFVEPRKVFCGKGDEDTEDEVNKFELKTLDPNKDDPGDSDDLGERYVSSLVLCRDSPRNSINLKGTSLADSNLSR